LVYVSSHNGDFTGNIKLILQDTHKLKAKSLAAGHPVTDTLHAKTVMPTCPTALEHNTQHKLVHVLNTNQN
jgi:hypothetical protein